MTNEFQGCGDYAIASLQANTQIENPVGLEGFWTMTCVDENGDVKWEQGFENQVMQVGKILMMNTTLYTASGYTLVGPFLGLITSSTGYSPTDTMASHTDWSEFINYTVGGSAVRATVAWNSGGSSGNNSTTSGANIVTLSNSSAPSVFTITGAGGTVTGCFLVTGSGASSAQSSTTGTLWSAGGFATAKTTTAGDTVTVTYSTTATS